MGGVIETGCWVLKALERQVSYTGLKSVKDPTTYDAGEPSPPTPPVKSPCRPKRAEKPQLPSGQESMKRCSLSPHIHGTKAEISLKRTRHHSCCDIKVCGAKLLLIRCSWLVCKDGSAPEQTQGLHLAFCIPCTSLEIIRNISLLQTLLFFWQKVDNSWQKTFYPSSVLLQCSVFNGRIV